MLHEDTLGPQEAAAGRWPARLRHLARANRAIIGGAGSLAGTTAVTSGLGFCYWWLAARLFPPAAVGLAAAAISAMTLLGTLGMLGLGTLLMGELPRRPAQARALIATALLAASLAGGVLGLLFAAAAPSLSPDLRPLGATAGRALLFALGVGLTAATLVLDQAILGLLRGRLQLARNLLFAAAKLGALLAAGLWLPDATGLVIYATWVAGIALSLAIMGRVDRACGDGGGWRPGWGLLRGLRRAALGHHGLNLALLAPGLLLPILVTLTLSAALNASFYIAWMLANLVYVGPAALATVLYAVGAADPSLLARKIRLTLRLAVAGGVLGAAALLAGANQLLGGFGGAYAEQAGASLRILGLGVFPLIVKDHYVAICRIHGRVARAALLITSLGALEIACAAWGARVGGLAGLCVGWVASMGVGAVIMARPVRRAARQEVVCSQP